MVVTRDNRQLEFTRWCGTQESNALLEEQMEVLTKARKTCKGNTEEWSNVLASVDTGFRRRIKKMKTFYKRKNFKAERCWDGVVGELKNELKNELKVLDIV